MAAISVLLLSLQTMPSIQAPTQCMNTQVSLCGKATMESVETHSHTHTPTMQDWESLNLVNYFVVVLKLE